MVTTSKKSKRTAPQAVGELPLLSLARQVRSWTDTLLGVAGSAGDIGMTLAQARIRDPEKKAAVGKAGSQLRQWREEAAREEERIEATEAFRKPWTTP